MSYQVLARKWRPKTFAEVVGQEHVVRALVNALEAKRLHHAYLFTGTRGVGKTTLARVLAKALNCETGITATPCGICAACTQIDAGRFVDLIEVDAATNTKVEEMRELLDRAQYMPSAARFKVYIIDEVHMLSRSAFNSMLKTLEEPPEHIKFVLATTDPQKVPVTILSRCLQFNLKQMPADAVAAHLRHILAQEKIESDARALALIGRAAQGSMRDGLSLLDQAIAHGAGKVESEQVSAMLGTIEGDFVFALLDHLAAQDGKSLLAEAARLHQRGTSLDAALQELAATLNQIALTQLAPDALDPAALDQARISALALRLAPDMVQLWYQIALNGRRDLALAPDEYAGFTMTLMRMLAFTLGASDAGEGGAPQARGGNEEPRSAAPQTAEHSSPRASARSEVAQPRERGSTDAHQASDSAPPQAKTRAAATNAFGGDWLAFVGTLNAGGMAQMLARHCELKSFTGDKLALTVAPEHKHLLDKPFQEKLTQVIQNKLGAPVRVSFALGEQNGSTLAANEDREQKARQSQAIAAIEQDPFVRDLIDQFDAKLIESSIKPIS